MDSRLEAHLIACLGQLEQGAPVEEILAPYPADTAAKLRPMLATAVQLNQLPLAHTVAAQANSKERFLAQATALRAKRPPRGQPWLIGLWGRLRLATAVALLAVIFFSGYIFLNTPNALPGDSLYGAKLTLENLRLATSSSDVLPIEIQAERRREVMVLLAADRSTAVVFQGELEVSDFEFWLVGGIPVIMTTDTVVDGSLEVGAEVRVKGQTADGRVWAREIVVLQPSPAPAPTATPAPALTATPTPTVTPAATQVKPSPTITAVFTATPTPIPTLTPLPSPTAVNNGNANGNDNGNDNDDDNHNNSNDNDDDDDNDDNGG